jgi:hypothetical protein
LCWPSYLQFAISSLRNESLVYGCLESPSRTTGRRSANKPSFQPPKASSKAGSSKQFSSSAYKKLKVDGGRPTLAKVTATLDSDDELIVRMKNAKYILQNAWLKKAASTTTPRQLAHDELR